MEHDAFEMDDEQERRSRRLLLDEATFDARALDAGRAIASDNDPQALRWAGGHTARRMLPRVLPRPPEPTQRVGV